MFNEEGQEKMLKCRTKKRNDQNGLKEICRERMSEVGSY